MGIEKKITLTDSDAELFTRALAEVKTTIYNESEARLSDAQAIEALILCFRHAGDARLEYLNLEANRYFVKNGLVSSDDAYPLFVF